MFEPLQRRFTCYDCSSTRNTNYKKYNKMPEFEETNSQPDPSHNYTPSTDASSKPRTRRRSGGFKTEVASASTANIGEVNAAEAVKGEKLSGRARPQERAERAPREPREPRSAAAAPRAQREPRAPLDREPRGEDDSEPEAREPRETRAEREPREPRRERAPREPREERITNPQPSEETLAAIKSVEASLTERRAGRDARRKEREKNRPERPERTERPERKNDRQPANRDGNKKPAAKKKGGLIASITGFFGKLFGKEPTKKSAGNRDGNRGGQNRQGGNRGGQNRQGGNRGGKNDKRGGQNRQGGNRGGQNRQGGNRGKGRREGGEKHHSATSLSNES
jgi:hypothetical protein